MLQRRRFLKTGLLITASGLLPTFGCARQQSELAMLSAASDKNDQHYGVLLNSSAEIINSVKLPERCHASVFNKRNHHALFFSRRPGTHIYALGQYSDVIEKTIVAAADRHFYGHGILVDNDRYLLTTENAFASGEGKICIRDTLADYKTVDEFPSYGIGPHELALMPDGKSLVVANGGIRTHPDKNRVAQNADDMQPNMSFIELNSGKLIASYKPKDPQMSLRHLSVNTHGEVFVGVQYMGSGVEDVPLVVKVNRERGISYLQAPQHFSAQVKQYTASVCSVNENTLVSCPKKHQLTLWSNNALQDKFSVRDVAGICHLKNANKLVVSGGDGDIAVVTIENNKIAVNENKNFPELRWDNHLIAVS